MLKGETRATAERPFVWHQPNHWGASGPGLGPHSAIRLGDWKYVFYHDPGRKPRQELFNLREDIGETKNLMAEHPEKAKELATLLQQRLQAMDAQMPTDKKSGAKITLP